MHRKSLVGVVLLVTISFRAAPALPAPPPDTMHDSGAMHASGEMRPTKEGMDLFEKRIRPALVRHCYECHSGDPKKAKGGFLLDTRAGLRKGGESGAAIVPGNAEGSLLVEAIRYEGLEMPPKEQLPDDLIADIVRWIELGAPDPRSGPIGGKRKLNIADARKWWSFQRPKAVPAPQTNDTSWPRSEIDHFILAQLERAGLKPLGDADRVTLIRRATFDLTGLPPTPGEIDEFVSDPSTDAFAGLVDRLLASPRFGERWGRHWLDVVRFGESTGKDVNVPYRYAWRYRDWVIDAFNGDEPYDKFIVEQLAGDLLPTRNRNDRDRSTIATGLLAIGPKGLNENNPEQFQMDVIDDQIDIVGRAFLGLTVACARCHDHKFDPIPTTDYYALAGIFSSTKTLAGVRQGNKNARDNQLLALNHADDESQPSPAELAAEKEREQQIARIGDEIGKLRQQIRQANRSARKKGKKKGVPSNQPVNVPQLREKIKTLEERADDLERVASPVKAVAMGVQNADSPSNCHVFVRGDLKERGPEVPRGTLTVLKTAAVNRINSKSSGRLELAHWIASRDNPLTARVMVNRIWQHLFGKGLVETVDNFGALGDEPSHPELLDALAVQFMNERWSVKQMIRSMMLSHVYQLSSEHSAENYSSDPSNRLLWRMERRRLDAEEIRDAILASSGRLQLERPRGSPMLELGNGRLGAQDLSPIRKPWPVRSVYLPIPRGIVPEVLQTFDMADPNLIVPKRDVTTVPTQALFLMNNPFVLNQSEQMARRVLADRGATDGERIASAFRITLGRAPTDAERAQVAEFLGDYRGSLAAARFQGNAVLAAWTSFCQTLLASGEFRYIY
jgi:hypothetical protein